MQIIDQIRQFITKHWKISAFILLVVVAVIFWIQKSKTPSDTEIHFEHPVRQDITKTLNVSGAIDAKERAQLRFLGGGKLIYLGAQLGDKVTKNQTIARVDASTQAKQQDKSLNNYLIERWNWENTQDDIKDETLTDNETRSVEQEQFRLNNAVIDVEIQQIAVNDANLYSPFAGVLIYSPTTVSNVQLTPSDYFEVVNPNTLIFRAMVDEVDIADVQIGQRATIELDAYRDQKLETEISYVAYTSSSTATGTVFLIELPVNSTDIGTYRLGMNGDVNINLASKSDVLTIPINATRERDSKVFVDVETKAGQYEEREIKLGLETDTLVEVVDGLTENDRVLIPE